MVKFLSSDLRSLLISKLVMDGDAGCRFEEAEGLIYPKSEAKAAVQTSLAIVSVCFSPLVL